MARTARGCAAVTATLLTRGPSRQRPRAGRRSRTARSGTPSRSDGSYVAQVRWRRTHQPRLWVAAAPKCETAGAGRSGVGRCVARGGSCVRSRSRGARCRRRRGGGDAEENVVACVRGPGALRLGVRWQGSECTRGRGGPWEGRAGCAALPSPALAWPRRCACVCVCVCSSARVHARVRACACVCAWARMAAWSPGMRMRALHDHAPPPRTRRPQPWRTRFFWARISTHSLQYHVPLGALVILRQSMWNQPLPTGHSS